MYLLKVKCPSVWGQRYQRRQSAELMVVDMSLVPDAS